MFLFWITTNASTRLFGSRLKGTDPSGAIIFSSLAFFNATMSTFRKVPDLRNAIVLSNCSSKP